MLEVARRQLDPWMDRVRIAQFDLRQSAIYEGFHAVFATLYTFNSLIEVEEQRLFLRHATQSMRSGGVLVVDFFCPLSQVRPDEVGEWRVIERTSDGVALRVRDRREMLTPLLERRTQAFRIADGEETEIVTHRRYITPQLGAALLSEAGVENVRWVQDYDLSTARPVEAADRPTGPFMLIGDR